MLAGLFADRSGERLPSEAEWEYAARSGGQDITYPWGDEAATCGYAVMDEGGFGCGAGFTWPVCSKRVGNTEQGLCDMAGNVWEWVADSWHGNYNGAPTDGSAGVDGGAFRFIRDGSYQTDDNATRATYRGTYFGDPEGYSNLFIGLRCAQRCAIAGLCDRWATQPAGQDGGFSCSARCGPRARTSKPGFANAASVQRARRARVEYSSAMCSIHRANWMLRGVYQGV